MLFNVNSRAQRGPLLHTSISMQIYSIKYTQTALICISVCLCLCVCACLAVQIDENAFCETIENQA